MLIPIHSSLIFGLAITVIGFSPVPNSPARLAVPPKRLRSAARTAELELTAARTAELELTATADTEAISPDNVLLVDHLNINHEKGRHDLLKAFYFDLLGCAVDPRKAGNLEKGKKTLWANAGIAQFHLPEGSPSAQVFDGVVTLAFEDLDDVRRRLASPPEPLKGTHFAVADDEDAAGALSVTDPWGSRFRLIAEPSARDARGSQPGPLSAPLGMPDLTVTAPAAADLAGIARFYHRVLGAVPTELPTDDRLVLQMGPCGQTLTFVRAGTAGAHRLGENVDVHPWDDADAAIPGAKQNLGAHISLYIRDLRASYRAADALGVTFVNHRFSRQAYTEEQAVDQCMFRLLDIVDPEAPRGSPPIMQLEHEVRSAIKADGSKYKSCPLDAVPSAP